MSDDVQMFPERRRLPKIGVTYEPIAGCPVSAMPGRRVTVGDHRLENDEALRLAQTIIEAYMWSAAQPVERNW